MEIVIKKAPEFWQGAREFIVRYSHSNSEQLDVTSREGGSLSTSEKNWIKSLCSQVYDLTTTLFEDSAWQAMLTGDCAECIERAVRRNIDNIKEVSAIHRPTKDSSIFVIDGALSTPHSPIKVEKSELSGQLKLLGAKGRKRANLLLEVSFIGGNNTLVRSVYSYSISISEEDS